MNANSKSSSITYNSGFNVTSITDPLSNTTSFEHNSFNKVTRIENAIGIAVLLGYDGNGNLTSVTDPDSNTAGLIYNSNGQVETVTDREGNRLKLNTTVTAQSAGLYCPLEMNTGMSPM